MIARAFGEGRVVECHQGRCPPPISTSRTVTRPLRSTNRHPESDSRWWWWHSFPAPESHGSGPAGLISARYRYTAGVTGVGCLTRAITDDNGFALGLGLPLPSVGIRWD